MQTFVQSLLLSQLKIYILSDSSWFYHCNADLIIMKKIAVLTCLCLFGYAVYAQTAGNTGGTHLCSFTNAGIASLGVVKQ